MADITVTLDGVSVIPDRLNDTQAVFDTKASTFAAELQTLGSDVNTFSSQANSLKADVNTARDQALAWADEDENVEVETGKYSAKHHAIKAEDARSEADTHRQSAQTAAAAAQSAAGLPSLNGAGNVLAINDSGDGVVWKNDINVQEFSANGTWTKPAGATVVQVELWGGGAGGKGGYQSFAGAGGGGGGKTTRIMRASDCAATEAVVIGQGGTGSTGRTAVPADAPLPGGNTTFGTLAIAIGGGSGAEHWEGGGLVRVAAPAGEQGSNTPGSTTEDGGAAVWGNSINGGPGGGNGRHDGADDGTHKGGGLFAGSTTPQGGGLAGSNITFGPAHNGASVPGKVAGGGGGGGYYRADGTAGNGGNGGIAAGGGGGGKGQTGGNGGNGGNGYARITSW